MWHRALQGANLASEAHRARLRTDEVTVDRQGVTWDLPNIAGAVAQGNWLDYCFIGDCFGQPNYTPLPR